jgi:hypothetical protein
MPKEIISAPEAPQSPMYSRAVKADNTCLLSGGAPE